MDKPTFSSTQWTTIDEYFFESQRKNAGTPIPESQSGQSEVYKREKSKTHTAKDGRLKVEGFFQDDEVSLICYSADQFISQFWL